MPETQAKSNIYLFYGEDDFSLRRKIDIWKTEFAKKYSPQAISFFDGTDSGEVDLVKSLKDQLAPSLFSTKKLIIIRDGLPTKAAQTSLIDFLLELSVPKDFIMVFWQTGKPDGRLGFTKKFLASGINTQEFHLPHGAEFNGWLKAMAKNLQAEISDRAVDLLAQFLGRDLFEEKKAGGRVIERKEAFDLWQAYSELSKLASAAPNITPEIVSALVKPKIPDSVFALSDNLASKDKSQAFTALSNYLDGSSLDEKSSIIKVIGLLAEQFRGLLLVNLLQEENFDNQQIAEKLGWSSGRVFVVSRNAKSFSISKLKLLLNQLLLIDQKLKTSDADPHLLVDLFITQTA